MDKPRPQYFNAIVSARSFALGIYCDENWVEEIVFLPPQYERMGDNPLAMEAASQLIRWLRNPHNKFDLPLKAGGTPFRRKVWQAISAIPVGETRSYGELAKTIGSAPRAVGGACGDNPFPIVVPCHRVVALGAQFNGGLGGFAHSRDGLHMEIKRWLLQHESTHARG
jgi:methylated-DNA-[protein]-cysteine S-methyltransferase